MPSARTGGEKSHGPFWSEPGTLLEHVPVAVFGLDDGDTVGYWGPGARDLFGYAAADVLARPGGVLFADGSEGPSGACAGLAERGRTLGYWRGRLPARHQDGTVFDCGFRAFAVTGAGSPPTVMVLASRSDELERVKTNLAFLDALFETCPIGLVMLDQDLRYVHLNQALADMDGLPIEDHLGRSVDEVMIMSDGGEYRRMLQAVASGGDPVVGALVGTRPRGHPDRDQVRSVSFFPLSQAVGSRPGVGGLMVDVTDREHAILEATAGRRRLALLDGASTRIGTTLDVNVTAQELVDASMPDFCDGAVVELVEWMDETEDFDPGRPLNTRRIASGTILPPPAIELVSGLETVRYPPGSVIHDMLRTGRAISAAVNEEFLARTVSIESRARLLAESGVACILVAPSSPGTPSRGSPCSAGPRAGRPSPPKTSASPVSSPRAPRSAWTTPACTAVSRTSRSPCSGPCCPASWPPARTWTSPTGTCPAGGSPRSAGTGTTWSTCPTAGSSSSWAT